jgi:SAM-dependent methyltransferase
MCLDASQHVLGRRLNHRQGVRPRRSLGVAVTVVQCKGCGLIFTNPRPVPQSLGDHYEKPPEEYWRPEQLEERTDHGAIPFDTFQTLHKPQPHTLRALDVGAGLGHDMLQLNRAGFDTWGLEPSAAFREGAIARGADPGRLKLATAETAEYDSGAFDLVSFGAVLEHLHDPAYAIERAISWLAPGGLLFAEVPSARWLMGRLLNLVYRVQGLDYVTNLSPMHDPYHLYEFTPEAFQRHGARAGYTVAHIDIMACETFLPKRIEPLAQKAMDRTGTGMQLAVWLTPHASA